MVRLIVWQNVNAKTNGPVRNAKITANRKPKSARMSFFAWRNVRNFAICAMEETVITWTQLKCFINGQWEIGTIQCSWPQKICKCEDEWPQKKCKKCNAKKCKKCKKCKKKCKNTCDLCDLTTTTSKKFYNYFCPIYSKALRSTFFGEWKNSCSSKSCIIRSVVCYAVFQI